MTWWSLVPFSRIPHSDEVLVATGEIFSRKLESGTTKVGLGPTLKDLTCLYHSECIPQVCLPCMASVASWAGGGR